MSKRKRARRRLVRMALKWARTYGDNFDHDIPFADEALLVAVDRYRRTLK